jgi:hypothetical protein
VVSPLLLNIALHGLEEAAGVRYYLRGARAGELKDSSPALNRYADDLVVCCHSRQQAEQVRAQLARWLEPRGLAFNDAKTRIVLLSLLTELRDIAAAQKAKWPPPQATALTGMPCSTVRGGCDRSQDTSESGYPAPNGSPSVSFDALVGVGHNRPALLMQQD